MRKLVSAGILMLLAPSIAFAQTVTIRAHNTPIQRVLTSITEQTGFAIFTSKDILEHATPVTIQLRNASLQAALTQILSPQLLTFQVASKTIFISRSSAIKDSATAAKRQTIYSGNVSDVHGNMLEGATITNINTGVQVMAASDGSFKIPATKRDVLRISSVGYTTKDISTPSTITHFSAVLETRESMLDETTIVAYGTTTRREATGALGIIKGREIAGVPSAGIANLLQGRAAGLDVTNVSGSPGAGGTLITIRGYNSLDVEQGRTFSNPLWVVDGVPLNATTSPVTGTSLLADINPGFIESIQVLKDASAAALYGSRAANGVIIIHTKKGKFKQRNQLELSLSQSYSIVSRLPDITIGKAERDQRLNAFLNYRYAYVDLPSSAYTYPASYRDVYLNPGSRLDYFFRREPGLDNGLYLQDSLNPFFNNATNFFPLFYRTGKITNANVQSYGGGENIHYGLGTAFYKEQGVVTGSSFDRVDLYSNIHVKATSKFIIDLRVNAGVTERRRSDKSSSLFGSPSPVIETVPEDPFLLSSLYPGEGTAIYRSLKNKLNDRKENNRSVRLRPALRLSFEPVVELQLSSFVAADYSSHRRNNFAPSTLDRDRLSRTQGESGAAFMFLNENTIAYERKLDGGHMFKALAGLSYQYDQEEYVGGQALNASGDRIFYARPGFPLLGERTVVAPNGQLITQTFAYQRFLSDMSEKALLSYFTRINYSFRNKYYATATFRKDGSSVFGENTRWGSFPSIGLGWIFSEENGVRSRAPWLSFGKLRTSVGKTGMHFSQNYLALGILQTGQYTHQGRSVIIPDFNDGLYNERLTWEETMQIDIGIDLHLFNERLSVTADYFSRFTDDMLMPVRLPGTYNGYLAQWRNAAAISNRGVEATIAYDARISNNFWWRSSINASRIWNRFERSFNGLNITPEYTTANRTWILGKPLNGIFGYRTSGLVHSQDELPYIHNERGLGHYLARDPRLFYKPGDISFVDLNNDGLINEQDQEYLGSALPELYGGINSQLRWKNFELNVLFSYQVGRNIINAVPIRAITTDDLGNLAHPLLADVSQFRFWTRPGDAADYPMVQYDGGSGNYDINVDRYVERVNWIKLKTVSARYFLPHLLTRKAGLKTIEVFGAVENLFTVSNYSGLDPEIVSITSGIDNGMNYPLARRFTLGVNFKL
jgi:TonB-linked SusC/RagA family outer membrane protein